MRDEVTVDEAVPASAPRATRRAVALSALRAVVTTVTLVTLYLALPISGTVTVSGGAVLAVGLLVFIGLLAWQIRSVTRSPFPILRALEVLGTAVPFLLLLFATSYFLLARSDPTSFSEPVSRLDALYFTVTVTATVGFGDIVARSDPARIAVTVQMLTDIVIIGVGIRLLVRAVRIGLSRRDSGARSGVVADSGSGASESSATG